MTRALALPWAGGIRAAWCSRSARHAGGGDPGRRHLGLAVTELAALGENNRCATGYLPSAEFEATADPFFAHPDRSVRGWERAADAQHRIVAAVDRVLAASADSGGDIAIISHGGGGTLLLCHLSSETISQAS